MRSSIEAIKRISTVKELESKIVGVLDQKERSELLSALAELLKYTDPQRGHLLGIEAQEIAIEMAHARAIAHSLKSQAECLLVLAEYDTVIEKVAEAVEQYEHLDDLNGKAEALCVAAKAQIGKGEYLRVIESYLESLKLFQKLGKKTAQVAVLSEIGQLYWQYEDYDKSIKYYLKALALCPKADGIDSAEVLGKIAEVYCEWGKCQDALKYLTKMLKSYEQYRNESAYAKTVENIGWVYRKMGQLEKAEASYLKSLKIRQSETEKHDLAVCLLNLSEIYLEQGETDKAEKTYQDIITISEENGYKEIHALASLGVGKVGLIQKRPKEAIPYLKKAVQSANDLKLHEVRGESHGMIAQAYEMSGDFKQAIKHYKAFYRLSHEVCKAKRDKRYLSLMDWLNFQKNLNEAEVHRLKHVELVEANRERELLRLTLEEVSKEKELLLGELREQAEALEQQVIRDGLTGLANRRHFDEQYNYEFNRALRYKRPLTIGLADIDHFKKVNDEFSHQIGDEVLKQIARIFKESCRSQDLVARYGGEEFVFLFTETSKLNAVIAAEKIRKAVEKYDWTKIHPALKVTISMGLSDDVTDGKSDMMISIADKKLYDAKHGGRNQVAY
ncbi:MAG: diguanylate cyclase [Chlorobiales bacterium]|nr:diguanylate cyclase [Chlorobiales bacterium]